MLAGKRPRLDDDIDRPVTRRQCRHLGRDGDPEAHDEDRISLLEADCPNQALEPRGSHRARLASRQRKGQAGAIRLAADRRERVRLG